MKLVDTNVQTATELFTQMVEIRKNIRRLCKSSRCQHLAKCLKKSTVCLKEEVHNKHRLVSKNGGDFQGYIRVRNILVGMNLNLVMDQVSKIGCNAGSFRDLAQEGHMGLIKAVERFDVSRGNKFSTYAYNHIRKTILRYIKDNNIVRKKGQAHELVKSVEMAFDRLVQDKTELTTGLVIQQIKRYRKSRGMTEISIQKDSIDHFVRNTIIQLRFPYDKYRKAVEPAVEQNHNDSLYELLNKKLDKDFMSMPVLLAQIIKMRFGLGKFDKPMSIGQISSILNLSRQVIDYKIKTYFSRKKSEISCD